MSGTVLFAVALLSASLSLAASEETTTDEVPPRGVTVVEESPQPDGEGVATPTVVIPEVSTEAQP